MCSVERDPVESYEEYTMRSYFVTSQMPKTADEYDTAVKYSRIYINVHNKKCVYTKAVMDSLKLMEKKVFVK